MARCKPQLPKPLSTIQCYVLAVLSVRVALGGALLLERFHFRDVGIPLLLFAVVIAAWYGGVGPAVLALLLSCVSFDYFFVEPLYTLDISRSDLPYFIVFASFASLSTWFSALESAQRMGNLIDDLLAFSRISRAETHKTMVSLEQLVQEALTEVRQDTGERNIVWRVGGLPACYGDRSPSGNSGFSGQLLTSRHQEA